MKKILLALAFAFALTVSANAQSYKNAVGVTLCPDFQGTAHIANLQWKHFFSPKTTLDVRAGMQFHWGPTVSVLYEWDFPIADCLDFYVGPGVHAGFIKDYNGFGDDCADFGLTAAAGLEYAFKSIPFAISFDWRPYLTWQPALSDEALFGWKGVELGVKYCF